MGRTRRIAAAALLASLLLFGCRTNMSPTQRGDVDAPHKVLVAGESTAFKERVVAALIDELASRDWYFRIIGLDQLKQQDTGEYGAILLVAAYRGGRLDGRVIAFLQGNPTNPKVVVFYTRGTEDPLPERSRPGLQVDAVSSASKDDRVERRAGELAALLRERF